MTVKILGNGDLFVTAQQGVRAIRKDERHYKLYLKQANAQPLTLNQAIEANTYD